MPAAPKTSRTKKYLHTFYLIQPVLQFFVLIAVITLLSRCSPLAASTAKNSALAGTEPEKAQTLVNESASALIAEDQVQSMLKDLGVADTKVVSQPDFDNENSSEATPNASGEEESHTHLFAKEKLIAVDDDLSLSHASKAMMFKFSKADLDTLIRDGHLRVDLMKYSANLDKNTQKNFLNSLKKNIDSLSLDATSYLILPSSDMQSSYSNVDLPIEVKAAVMSENSAVLDLRVEPSSGDDANKALLNSALNDAQSLAIVLE